MTRHIGLPTHVVDHGSFKGGKLSLETFISEQTIDIYLISNIYHRESRVYWTT